MILPIRAKYVTDDIPPTSYNITINKFSRKLHAETYYSDSTGVDVGHTVNNSTKLTFKEYWRVWFIYYFKPFDREHLISALDSIASGTEVMFDSDDFLYEDQKHRGINNDGLITDREFGNSMLDTILKR